MKPPRTPSQLSRHGQNNNRPETMFNMSMPNLANRPRRDPPGVREGIRDFMHWDDRLGKSYSEDNL